ncbi:MAG: amidase family protein [Eubacteriales bacterium]|nr:amidase family protein [Eubacteriales bacterium]
MKKIAIDDTIMIKGELAQAGSHILEGYRSLFDAEVVTRIKNAGYEISGKTATGEFGLDLVGEFSYGAEQKGKLHGDAALQVAGGETDAALAVDMNGSARRAAALSGITFIKPTYGTVSRYGIISCAASGEQVGVYARGAEEAAQVLEAISGHDDKDGTSLPEKEYKYRTEAAAGGKIAVIRDPEDKADEDTKMKMEDFKESLKASGVTVDEIELDFLSPAATAWQILMCAETCNNISRYDGVKFGHRADNFRNIDELYINTRTEGFNFLTKAVILYGSDVLSKNRYKDCYEKSLKIRRIVADSMAKIFEEYDAVLTPVCSKTEYEAYDIDEAFGKVFEESEFTAIPNLIGIPAIVSGGVQMMGDKYCESKLFSLAAAGERGLK